MKMEFPDNIHVSDEILALKAGVSVDRLAACGLLAFWRDRQRQFRDNLRLADICAISMDYDGTVYAGGQRDNAVPDPEMAALLTALLERGLCLGFASGRGESLRDGLRQCFSRHLWPRIYVAYQDGAECGRLDDDALPTAYDAKKEHPALAQARQRLTDIFAAWPDAPAMRPENMLLGVYGPVENGAKIFAACCDVAVPLGLKVFHGGRMTDITLPHVSKRNLARVLPAGKGEILAMGDAGAWPGNDCELLANPLGVSVGSMSADPICCWRLVAATGTEAAKEILGFLAGVKGSAAGNQRYLLPATSFSR